MIDKYIPLHNDLLHSISHTFDTYWPSLMIDDDSLSNKMMTKQHFITNNLLISNFPC